MRPGVSSPPATGGALLLAGALLAAQGRAPTTFEQVGSFGPLLRESSGVAVSRRHSGVLWTHNDSRGGPYLYATRLDGTLLGHHEVLGASAVDWEDLDLAPCPGVPGDCLYVADTGDNEGRRRAVTLYIVPEPDTVEALLGGHPRPTKSAWALLVTYPDGPHDVEALWVAPDGSVELVTKGLVGPIRRYRIPRASLNQDTVMAQAAGLLPVPSPGALGRWVTGAALAPNGRQVAVRTYTEILFFRIASYDSLVPLGAPCWLGTKEPQGEAVAFLDDETLVLTSEAFRAQSGLIHRVRC
ncbi:MAG TPA: hypothetical protein VF970_13015 [Gemmatimonadales bacterium]